MGLFGGLFEKKVCDICGNEIGLLGNRKLEDGNMCKDCESQLSPFFSDRRQSTVDEILEQLEYREENQAAVEEFHVTRTLGRDTKVLLDEDAGKFIVTDERRWQEYNPDVIDFSQVTGCTIDVDEEKDELYREGEEGRMESYRPPRYRYEYSIYVNINVNNPYFDEINIFIGDVTMEEGGGFGKRGIDPMENAQYRNDYSIAEQIVEALTQVRKDVRDSINAANAPKMAATCPFCGATTTPDDSGCCEFCGGAVNG